VILYFHKAVATADRRRNDKHVLMPFKVESKYAQVLWVGLDGHDGRPGKFLSKK
jgi:hypothetical protein